MRLLDIDSDKAVSQAQLYLTTNEAEQLLADLRSLLANSEASEHHHLFSEDGGCEISYSLITSKKLENISLSKYTAREQKLLIKHK